MRLLSGQKEDAELDAETAAMLADHHEGQIFAPQERRMIERVLNLNQRTVSSIMTSRHDIEHIDLNAPETEIRALLEKNFPLYSKTVRFLRGVVAFPASDNRVTQNRKTTRVFPSHCTDQ